MSLSEILPVAIRLLYYIDHVNFNRVQLCLSYTGLSRDEVISTRCGPTTDALLYLFSPTESKVLSEISFDPTYIYEIHLQGLSEQTDDLDSEEPTSLGHSMLVLFEEGTWYVLDSYIGKRGFTKRAIPNIDDFQKILHEIQISYYPSKWQFLTSEYVSDPETARMEITFIQHKGDTSRIHGKYQELLERAKKRLLEEEIGQDDNYLALLDSSLDLEAAKKKLEAYSLKSI
jgi:hypothetical protein